MMRSLFLLCCLAAAAGLPAAEFGVGPDETYRTIQSAVDAVPRKLTEPCVIRIAPGTYPEMVTVSGIETTAANWLTLRGAGESTVIDAEGIRPHAIKVEKQQYVAIEDLSAMNAKSYGNIFFLVATNNAVRRCSILNSRAYDGITLSTGTNTVIEHCVFAFNHRAGVYLTNSSANATVRFNIFYGNSTGVEMGTQYPSLPLLLDFNCFYGNRANVANVKQGEADLIVDPRFADVKKRNFELTPASPCPRWGLSGDATQEDPGPKPSAPKGANIVLQPNGFFLVKLDGFANASLADGKAGDRKGGWTDQGDWDMRHLPRGIRTLGEIPWLLPANAEDPSVIVLRGERNAWQPERVAGIPVGRTADRLYFLQACAWAAGGDVATYIVHYADGRSVAIPVRFRVETADWYMPHGLENLPVAWKGVHPLHPNVELGLYAFEWDNPYPFTPIKSIDLVSVGIATPMLAAISGRAPSAQSDGRLVLTPGRAKDGLRLACDYSTRTPGTYGIAAILYDESGKAVQELKPQAIAIGPNAPSARAEFTFSLPAPAADTNYRFGARVLSGDRTVAEATTPYPVKGNAPVVLPDLRVDPALPPGGDNIFYSCEIQPVIQIHRMKFDRGERPKRIDPKIFDTLKANGGTVAHLVCWWSYLEPKPFEYDFSDLEYALAECRRVGLKAQISVWMGDHNVPGFCIHENMIDQYGNQFLGARGTNAGTGYHPSLWGPDSRKHFSGLIREIGKRYLDDPEVVSWGFLYQHVEVTIHDRVGKEIYLYDYSPWAQENFRRYLREERGFSLDALNRRYGTAFADWKQVEQPKPDKEIEVTPRWNDFQDFRVYSIRNIFEFVFKTVKGIDPEGKKIHFTFNPIFAADLCVKYGVVIDSTGSEQPENIDKILWDRAFYPKHPMMVEPTSIPPDVFELNSGFFNALSAPVQGYLWVGTTKGFPKDTPAAEIFRRMRYAWTLLSESRPLPPQIATLQSFDTVHALEKIITHSNRTLNYRWLLRRLQASQYAWLPVVDDIAAQNGYRLPQPFRLILDDDSKVMREGLMKLLIEQVQNGATLVLNPDSGRFCREKPVPEASLAARFGLDAGTKPLAGAVRGVVKEFGKGRVVRLDAMYDWSGPDADRFLQSLAELAKVERPVVTVPGVRAAVMTREGRYYVLIFNESPARSVAATVRLPGLPAGRYARKRVSNGGAAEGTVENNEFQLLLTPHELRIYELTPEK